MSPGRPKQGDTVMTSKLIRRVVVAVAVAVAVLAGGAEAGAQYKPAYKPGGVQYNPHPSYVAPKPLFAPATPFYQPQVFVQPAPRVIVFPQVKPAVVQPYSTWGWRYSPFSGWGWGFGW